MDKERIAKVVVIGDMGVGKTSLLHRFTDNKFYPTSIVTIGADFKRRVLEFDDTKITLELWDTAGQERYKSLTSRFFRHAHGVLLVYDVTSKTSFTGIQNWINELDYHGINPRQCLLVGNKIDMDNQRSVEMAQAMFLARRHDIQLMETSAKEDKNVHQTFVVLARLMMTQMKDLDATNRDNSLVVSFKYQHEDKKRKKHSCKLCSRS